MELFPARRLSKLINDMREKELMGIRLLGRREWLNDSTFIENSEM